jgi:prepilin-type N-terminal cleavage/methylation domain-containing protein
MVIRAQHGSPARVAPRGYTLPELVAVLVIAGVLAAVALPRLNPALDLRADTTRDQVVAALRHAGATAVGHRRLVCATVAATSVSLQIAAANPATACGTALPGPTGTAAVASSASISQTPAGTLHFQPSGRVTSDAAGLNAGLWTLGVSGTSTPISLIGETGHVE